MQIKTKRKRSVETTPFMLLLMPAAVFWACSFPLEQVFRLHMQPEDLEREAAKDALDRQNNS